MEYITPLLADDPLYPEEEKQIDEEIKPNVLTSHCTTNKQLKMCS